VIGTGGFLSLTTGLLRTVGYDTIDCLAVRDGAGVRLTVVWVLTDCID
jgi:hypothetical protein